MSDIFNSPKRRLMRAKKKFEALVRRSKIFQERKPYSFVTEPDTNSSLEFYKFKITKKLPLGVQDLAWEIVEELRSALDQTGYACAIASGKIAPKNTYFPIADSAPQLETDVIGRGRCKDLPPDIVTLFRGFKPYKGGNDAIWALNRLANSNKHRLLIPAGGVAEQSVGVRYLQGAPAVTVYVPVWNREKNEMLVMSAPIGSNLKYDLDFAFFIAFGEVEAVAGQPAIPILYAMIREIEGIVMATEAECRRIGLLK